MQSIWPLLAGLNLFFPALTAREILGRRKRKVRVASWGDRQENLILIDLEREDVWKGNRTVERAMDLPRSLLEKTPPERR